MPRNAKWAVVALLAWYFISAVSAVANKCVTFDELFHLPAGYSYWKFGDFRIQPQNGNLPQRWAAIPLLFASTHFPDRNQDDWHSSRMAVIGDQFYGVGNDADAMLLRGRAMIALLGVALGALIFFWMKSLMGLGPALVSLVLYSFCPTMLANGALVTSDMAAALFFNGSMFCIWRVLHRVNWHTLLVGALVMGGLFVAKFSAPMIVPMGLALLAIQLASREPTIITFGNRTWKVTGRWSRLPIHVAAILIHAIVVWCVIWAFYDFRYDMFATTQPTNVAGQTVATDAPEVPWDDLLDEPGLLRTSINSMRSAHVLPEAYLYGFAHTWSGAQQRSSFLNGEFSRQGRPQFFPYCLLVKTPLPLFVLMALSVAWLVRQWDQPGDNWPARLAEMRGSLYRTAPLWTLFAVYWIFALRSQLNIGHRHLLPTYPPMLMLAGTSWMWLATSARTQDESQVPEPAPTRKAWSLRRWLATRRWPKTATVVVASVSLFAADSLWRWPNYLAYFNPLVGGPSYGYRHLVDSSLDWGQDLPALKQWLEKQRLNDPNTAYLSYFGTGSPTYYGIEATLLPSFFDISPLRIPEPLKPGVYCISATMLQSVYTAFHGRWNRDYEDSYQKLESNVRRFSAASTDEQHQLVAQFGEDFWTQCFRRYEQARLARLANALRQREPETEVNNSILIYRLNESELKQALEGPPVELDD